MPEKVQLEVNPNYSFQVPRGKGKSVLERVHGAEPRLHARRHICRLLAGHIHRHDWVKVNVYHIEKISLPNW